jgi:hypothetical protein
MKRSLIDIGGEYAVDFTKPGRGSFPRVVARRRCTIVDKRSNGRIVVQYDAMVPDRLAKNAGEILHQKIEWRPGSKVVEVADHQIVARWGEQPAAQIYDGRPKDERTDEQALDGAA